MLKSLPLLALLAAGGPLAAQLSGSYTIGGPDGHFATLAQAAQALKSAGVSGSVIFRLRPGTYAAATLFAIPGASAQHRVVFEAESADALSTTVRGVCELNGAQWVTLRHLRLTNQNGQTKAVVRLWNTHEVRIEHCRIEESPSPNYAYDEGLIKLHTVQAPDSVRNYFSHCHINSATRSLVARNNNGRFLFEYCHLTGNWDLWLGEYRGAFWHNNITFHNTGAHNVGELYYNTIASSASQPYLDLICGKFVGNTIAQPLHLNASLIEGNTFLAQTSIRRAGEGPTTIARNRFHVRTDFFSCLSSRMLSNEFRGLTYIVGCDGTEVCNNLFYQDTEITFGTGYRVMHNNFAPGTLLLFWFMGGLALNNNISNLNTEWASLTLRDNNYFPSGPPGYSVYQDSHPRFYAPQYVSPSDNLRATNPLLIGKAGAVFFPSIAQDVDGKARTYPATIGANELCYEADFPDTVWISCTEGSPLRWCSPALAAAHFWTPLDRKDTLPAQTSLWPQEGARTLLLHGPTGVTDTVVFALAPFAEPSLSKRKYYAWCGTQAALNTYAPPTAQVSWSPAQGLDNPHSSKPLVYLTDTITYVATIQVGHCPLLRDTLQLYVDQRPRAYFEVTNQKDGLVQFANYATCADTYRWDFGDGTTSDTPAPQHQYSAEGYYTVSLTAENAYGKATYAEQIYVFLPKVAVSTPTEAAFRVYPNPISGRFRVELEASLAGAVGEACFINSSGQTLRCQPVAGAGTIELDAVNLPAGSYLLTLRFGDRLLKRQILIIR